MRVASDLFSLDIFHWKKWRHFFNPTYTQHARSLSLSLSLSKQKDIRARRRDDEEEKKGVDAVFFSYGSILFAKILSLD